MNGGFHFHHKKKKKNNPNHLKFSKRNIAKPTKRKPYKKVTPNVTPKLAAVAPGEHAFRICKDLFIFL